MYQKDISDSNFRQASNCCKSIHEAAKLACANKTGNFGELLIVFSTKIAAISPLFNGPGATWPVALDISKAFDTVWHAGILHKLKSYGISG